MRSLSITCFKTDLTLQIFLFWCEHGTTKNNLKFIKEKKIKSQIKGVYIKPTFCRYEMFSLP